LQERIYKRYLLIVLAMILAFNQVERLALGLTLQDIKVDLDLTDTQLGLLSGIAFALFYAVMGIPIARWADRGNRVTIISLATALWCGALALCGLAASFVQLLLIRIGVAVGEAGCTPPAHSLIAEYFTRGQRPRAVAGFLLGGPLAAMIGYFLVGWLNELHGWRVTFLLLGIPGIFVAVIAKLTLREPRAEQAAETRSLADVAQPGVGEVCRSLWNNTTFRHLLIGFSVVTFFGFGIQKWKPAFFIRSHGMGTGELGAWFAGVVGLGGLFGTWLGGALASRHAANQEALQLKAIAATYAALGIVSAFIYLAPERYLSFGCMALTTVGGSAAVVPLLATIQTLVHPRMRAMSIAIVYLFANLIGLGLGPLTAGALSDALRPVAGEESLRYALLALCPGYLWGAWHISRAGNTVAADLEGIRHA
jgi:MFS transporter, Spinster family, sphingosine-1-phosphate transporter